MAVKRHASQYKRMNRMTSRHEQAYVYGNTVRQPEVLPKRVRRELPVQPKRTSSQVNRNRRRAMSMSPAYTVFLTTATICAVLICVAYLKLQSDVVNRGENVSKLQESLGNLTEENDTAYNAASDSVNLEEVRTKAMSEMGMVYAVQGNVVEYASPTSNYKKQYSDIPTDGVVTKSKNSTN